MLMDCTYLFECLRYTVTRTIQTTANRNAAANVRPAITGEIGTYVPAEGPARTKS